MTTKAIDFKTPEGLQAAQEKLHKDPLAYLHDLADCFSDRVSQTLLTNPAVPEELPDDQADFIVRMLTTNAQMLTHAASNPLREMPAFAGQRELMDATQVRIEDDIRTTVTAYGDQISHQAERIYSFAHQPDENLTTGYCPATLANFNALQENLLQNQQDQAEQRRILKQYLQTEIGSSMPGGAQFLNQVQRTDGGLLEQETGLKERLYSVWQDESVRMAHQRQEHMKCIGDAQNHRSIHESETVIQHLNNLHGRIYGADRRHVVGPTLTGPPGEGKTSLLQEYFRMHGIEPISIDIDPGQSSFTLMARPTIGDQTMAEQAMAHTSMIDQLDKPQIEILVAQDPDFFEKHFELTEQTLSEGGASIEELRALLKKSAQKDLTSHLLTVLKSQTTQRGFAYGNILQGLIKNTPIIINEFPELDNWTFLHSLLHCIPADDETAGPRPETRKQEEGKTQKNPIGWFFNTITSEWMRVGDKFCITFTGNVGSEHGTSIAANPAMASRLAMGGSLDFQGLPPEEMTRSLAWAHLCDPMTGHFALTDNAGTIDDESAYQMHFLVQTLIPKLKATLTREYGGRNEFLPFSNRVLIEICKSINPQTNHHPCNIDEALMAHYVRDAFALGYTDSLRTIIPLLIGSGFLNGYKKEIEGMISNLGSARLSELIDSARADQVSFKPHDYSESKKNYQHRCPVCGVKHCPVHGEEAQKYAHHVDHMAELGKMGLNPLVMKSINEYQQELIATENWTELLQANFGTKDDSLSVGTLSEKASKSLTEFLKAQIENTKDNPVTFLRNASLFALGVEKKFISRDSFQDEKAFKNPSLEYLVQTLDEATQNIKETENGSESKAAKTRSKTKIRKNTVQQVLRHWTDMQALFVITPEEAEPIRKAIQSHMRPLRKYPEIISLIHQCPDFKELITREDADEPTGVIMKHQDDWKEDFEKRREAAFNPPIKAISKRAQAVMKDFTIFESQFLPILTIFKEAKELYDLKVIPLDRLMEIAGQVKTFMAQRGIHPDKPMKITLPYIEAIQMISEIQESNMQVIVEHMMRKIPVDLPTLPTYRS